MTGYGTRSSTVLIVSARGEVHFIERTFTKAGTREVRFRFSIREE